MIVINADKELEKVGFVKVYEDKNHIIQYERSNEKYGYVQCLDIVHKGNGKHLIQSYQKDINKEGFNNCVGLTALEAELAIKKMKKMKWKR